MQRGRQPNLARVAPAQAVIGAERLAVVGVGDEPGLAHLSLSSSIGLAGRLGGTSRRTL
jgi:hypothetical protein